MNEEMLPPFLRTKYHSYKFIMSYLGNLSYEELCQVYDVIMLDTRYALEFMEAVVFAECWGVV